MRESWWTCWSWQWLGGWVREGKRHSEQYWRLWPRLIPRWGYYGSVIRKIRVCPQSTNPIITHSIDSVVRVQCELCTFGNGAHQSPTPVLIHSQSTYTLYCDYSCQPPSAYLLTDVKKNTKFITSSLHALQALHYFANFIQKAKFDA